MNRRTKARLAQILLEMDRGETSGETGAAPSHAAELRDHIDTWDRLGRVRPSDPDQSHVAAGRERMFSALFASGMGRRRGSPVSLMSSIVRLSAALTGVLVLTGAATGASVAVGGPDIWSSVGVNRSNDAAMERSDAIEANLEVTDSQAAPVSAGDAGESVASDTGPDEAGTIPDPATDGAEEAPEEGYVAEEETESHDDGLASAAEPSGEAELSGDAASSDPGDEDDEDGDDINADAATPR